MGKEYNTQIKSLETPYYVTVSPSNVHVTVGSKVTITATILDYNTLNPVGGSYTVMWSSDNTGVATVSPSSGTTNANGQTSITMTATGAGSVKLYAKYVATGQINATNTGVVGVVVDSTGSGSGGGGGITSGITVYGISFVNPSSAMSPIHFWFGISGGPITYSITVDGNEITRTTTGNGGWALNSIGSYSTSVSHTACIGSLCYQVAATTGGGTGTGTGGTGTGTGGTGTGGTGGTGTGGTGTGTGGTGTGGTGTGGTGTGTVPVNNTTSGTSTTTYLIIAAAFMMMMMMSKR